MAAASTVCRLSAEVLGLSYDSSTASVLATTRGDGVACYSVNQQRRIASYPLGTGRVEFQAPAVQHGAPGGAPQPWTIAAAVFAAGTNSLVRANSSGAKQQQAFRTVSDVSPRIALPCAAHSCHVLHPGGGASSSSSAAATVAVVLVDGRVGAAPAQQDGALELQLLPPTQAPHPAPQTILAASRLEALAVVTQARPGEPASIRLLRAAGSGMGLTAVKASSLPCPSRHATPCAVALSASYALLQWTDGTATVIHEAQSGQATPLKATAFALKDGAAEASTSAPAAAAGGASPAANRKRKNPPTGAAAADTGGGGAAPSAKVLCAVVDGSQFLVLDFDSAAARSEVCYCLRDAQFGCPLSAGSVAVDAPLLSLTASQIGVVHSDSERTVLRLGGAVVALSIPAQPVSLLSLIARLSLSNAAAAASGRPAVAAAAAGPLVQLPQPVAIGTALLRPAAPSPAEAVAAAAGSIDATDTLLQPVPADSLTRMDDTCNQLVSQLFAVAASGQPPGKPLLDSAVSYISGCREHGVALPPQLLALTARGLSSAAAWQQLGSLLAALEPGSLSGCSEVLPAVARAQQYALLPRLATVLDEVSPSALVEALQVLLAPTTRANAASRRQHHAAMRAAAEGLVANAEDAAAGGGAAAPRRSGRHHSGSNAAPGTATVAPAAGHLDAHTLALAQCAASALDGFGYREVLLHPLLAMPIDGMAVQGALRSLPHAQVEALLGYLAKWLGKYAGGSLGDASASVSLPQELLFPYFGQILEWTRITIDAHLTRLLMSPSPLPAVEALEAALTSAVASSQQLVRLRGATEHIQAAAPLPAAHIESAMQYTVEVLDLRVRHKAAAAHAVAAS